MKIKFKKHLPDKWFLFPIIGLALCLVLKIIQTAINFSTYPFHSIVDLNGKLLYLSEFVNSGFHHVVDDTYHHLILFKDYPPGWHYFTLPFYIITQDLLIAIFLSLLAILTLGFLFIYIFNKDLTPVKRIAFFCFFFGNPLMIDYLQIGRYPELLAWIIFIALFYYIILYQKRKIDFNFFFIITTLLSSLILTHVYVATIGSIFIISLFLIKNYKEKLIIFLTVLTSFALTSFWWISFLDFIKNLKTEINSTKELLNSSSIISYNTIFILGLFFIAFFYIKQRKNKKNNKEILFFIPSLILGFLMLTRLIVFVPLFNKIAMGPYDIYLSFLIIYLFFRIDFKIKIKRLIFWSLIFLTFSSLCVYYLHNKPFIPHKDELKAEIISFFPIIEDNFFLFDFKYKQIVTDYAKINYGLSSPGRYPGQQPLDAEFELKDAFKERDCQKLKLLTEELQLKNLISYDQGCDILKECDFDEKLHKERACVFS